MYFFLLSKDNGNILKIQPFVALEPFIILKLFLNFRDLSLDILIDSILIRKIVCTCVSKSVCLYLYELRLISQYNTCEKNLHIFRRKSLVVNRTRKLR